MEIILARIDAADDIDIDHDQLSVALERAEVATRDTMLNVVDEQLFFGILCMVVGPLVHREQHLFDN